MVVACGSGPVRTARVVMQLHERRSLWTLDPSVHFLNHGSFGACPRPVLERQVALRAQLESEPVRFFVRDLEPLLDEATACLAALVGARTADLAWVPNATTGVSTVLRSLAWQPGDEIVATDHTYNACRNALDFICQRHGVRLVIAPVPFPLSGPDDVERSVLAAVGAKTRLALLDHVTSPTGLVLPLTTLVPALQARGVDVLVDGAHGPGMLSLDLDALGAAYYTGNCHKWLCTPKGAAFLHVRRDRQAGLEPLAISHGRNSPRTDRTRFQLDFAPTPTADPSPFLCLPVAVRFLEQLFGSLPALQQHNRDLTLAGRRMLCDALDSPPPCPESMLGSLATVLLPPLPEVPPGLDPVQDALWHRHRIEVPVVNWPSPQFRGVRIAMQAYNDLDEVARLAAALRSELAQV